MLHHSHDLSTKKELHETRRTPAGKNCAVMQWTQLAQSKQRQEIKRRELVNFGSCPYTVTPKTVRADCEAIAQRLHTHCIGDDPSFLLGNFPDIWRRITESAQGEDIIIDQPTFWGPNGSSSLDRAVLPVEYMNKGLIQHQVYYDRLFESSGHASITIKGQLYQIGLCTIKSSSLGNMCRREFLKMRFGSPDMTI